MLKQVHIGMTDASSCLHGNLRFSEGRVGFKTGKGMYRSISGAPGQGPELINGLAGEYNIDGVNQTYTCWGRP
jgi:hypothetical protein